jgi:hypothetical protein
MEFRPRHVLGGVILAVEADTGGAGEVDAYRGSSQVEVTDVSPTQRCSAILSRAPSA